MLAVLKAMFISLLQRSFPQIYIEKLSGGTNQAISETFVFVVNRMKCLKGSLSMKEKEPDVILNMVFLSACRCVLIN